MNWAATFEITRILMGLSQLLGGIILQILKEKIELPSARPKSRPDLHQFSKTGCPLDGILFLIVNYCTIR
jgi:hypothetical protein